MRLRIINITFICFFRIWLFPVRCFQGQFALTVKALLPAQCGKMDHLPKLKRRNAHCDLESAQFIVPWRASVACTGEHSAEKNLLCIDLCLLWYCNITSKLCNDPASHLSHHNRFLQNCFLNFFLSHCHFFILHFEALLSTFSRSNSAKWEFLQFFLTGLKILIRSVLWSVSFLPGLDFLLHLYFSPLSLSSCLPLVSHSPSPVCLCVNFTVGTTYPTHVPRHSTVTGSCCLVDTNLFLKMLSNSGIAKTKFYSTSISEKTHRSFIKTM